MNVISRPKLKKFCEDHADAREWLENWWRVASKAKWTSLKDLQQLYSATDQVDRCLVFDKGNKYRLIVAVRYAVAATKDAKGINGTLFLKHFLTHAEYDKGFWKCDCQWQPQRSAKSPRPKRTRD